MQKKISNDASPESPLVHNPFDRLKGLVAGKNTRPSRPAHQESEKRKEKPINHQTDEQLFLEAMEDVKPVERDQVGGRNREIKPSGKPKHVHEDESLSRLIRLIDHGEGFIISDTPEYIEGTGYNVHQEFARRLHQGDFSIQAHIDLHGLNVESAKEAVEAFLKTSFHTGKRAVLIIHGRGLSSPGEPVLKNKIQELLNQKYWLKRMIAYTSAQSYDGGTGATYVLLRSRPVSAKRDRR